MNYSIPVHSLAFALQGAAVKDVRYYLQGIHVAGHDCTGTDGRIALRIRDEAQVAPAPLLLPIEAATWAVKAAKAGRFGIVEITVTEGHATLAVGSATLVTPVGDVARFPPVDASIPDETSGESVSFDSKLLARINKAAEVVASGVRMRPNGKQAAVVDFPGSPVPCFGVVMPLRTEPGNPVTFRSDAR